MDQDKLRKLREYYDKGNSVGGEDGVWETDVEDDPMVTTSIRLPRSLLDWVRAQADEQGAKPTALIRQWIEARHDDEHHVPNIEDRLAALENAVFAQPPIPRARAHEAVPALGHDVTSRVVRDHAPAQDSTDAFPDLLAALKASVVAVQSKSDGKRKAEQIVNELRAFTEDISHSA